MLFKNFLESIKNCEEDIKVKSLSKNNFDLVIESVVEPFYHKLESDNFIEDRDLLFKLKIKQSAFTLKFLTKDFGLAIEELDKIILLCSSVKLKSNHFIPYFFIWSNLILNWLTPKSNEKNICRWKNKILKFYAYLSYGHFIYDFEIYEKFKNINGDLAKIKNKISAKEFINSIKIDKEILDEMAYLEKDLDEILSADEGISEELMASFTLFIFKYAKLLAKFNEFKELSFALNSLVNVLEKVKFSQDDKKNKQIKILLSSIIEDLENWKKVTLDKASTNDIHFLDTSLFSSCAQFELLLTKDKIKNPHIDDISVELF